MSDGDLRKLEFIKYIYFLLSLSKIHVHHKKYIYLITHIWMDWEILVSVLRSTIGVSTIAWKKTRTGHLTGKPGMRSEIPKSLSRATTWTLSPHRHLLYRDTVLTKTLPQSRKKEAIATSVCKAKDGGKVWGTRWLERKGAYHNAGLPEFEFIGWKEKTDSHSVLTSTHTHTLNGFLKCKTPSYKWTKQTGHTPRHPEVWDLYYAGRADQTVPCCL